jgi:DNA-binding CsgD family transcriptional regulator
MSVTASRKALIAIRNPLIAGEVRDYLIHSSLQFVGIVDPRLKHVVAYWRDQLDAVITSAADLRWFPRWSPTDRPSPRMPGRLVVLLEPSELIELQRHTSVIGGLVFRRRAPELVVSALELAVAGYCALPSDLKGTPSLDEARLRHLEKLSELERRTLELLAEASATRTIARSLDVSYAHAKTLVRGVLMKLQLENRTAGAVFAARSRSMCDDRESRTMRTFTMDESNGESVHGPLEPRER